MNRRSRIDLVVALTLLTAAPRLPAQELEVEDVVYRCIEALGGQANWDAVRSLRLTGQYSTFSAPRPFVLYRQRPDLYRFEYFYEAGKMILVHDGEMSWWINRSVSSQVPWPEPAPPVHARAILGDAEFGTPLFDYNERGHQVELEGLSDLDGEATYRLVVRLAHGAVESWHLDPESFLPVARIRRGADSRMEVEQRDFFMEYREVAGILFPHKVEIELGFRYQSLEVEKVEINPEIDESLFKMPVPAGMERLRDMAGRWNVHVRSRPYPRMPWFEEDVTSTVRSLFHGALLEEEIVHTVHATRRYVRRSVSYDRFRDVFRITRFDSLTSHIDVLEGGFDEGRLVASNLETGTAWTIGEETFHARESVYDLSPEGFQVDWEVSTDGGRTWDVLTQYQYRRVGKAP